MVGCVQFLLGLVCAAAPALGLNVTLITRDASPLLASSSASLPLSLLCSLLRFARQSLKVFLTNPGCRTQREGS